MVQCIAFNLGLHRSTHGPAAARRVLDVFHQRVVTLLPAVHALLAEEADYVVGVVGPWLEEEACAGEL